MSLHVTEKSFTDKMHLTWNFVILQFELLHMILAAHILSVSTFCKRFLGRSLEEIVLAPLSYVRIPVLRKIEALGLKL